MTTKFITYIALGSLCELSVAEVLSDMRSIAGNAPFTIGQIGSETRISSGGVLFTVNSVAVLAMMVDVPLPEDAWETAAQRAIIWPEAEDTLARNRAHVVVATADDMIGHPLALAGASAVTLLAGAIANRIHAIGGTVLGTVFSESESAVEGVTIAPMAARFAQQREIPDMLWASIQFYRGEKESSGQESVGAVTTGLMPFIGKEMEFLPNSLAPGETARRLLGLCSLVMLNGPVIKDGDSVGLTVDEKIMARFAAEGQRRGIPVIQFGAVALVNVKVAAPAVDKPIFGKRGNS